MNTELDKKLFKLFAKHKCENYDMFAELRTVVEGLLQTQQGESDRDYYSILAKLHNSENNANW